MQVNSAWPSPYGCVQMSSGDDLLATIGPGEEWCMSCARSRSTVGTSAFSVAGPTIWNSLPDHLWDLAVDSEQFRRDLKTYLFAGHS